MNEEKIYAADKGLLDRRLFLRSGGGGMMALGLGTWLQPVIANDEANKPAVRTTAMETPGAPFSYYGKPSAYEDQTVRFPSANAVVPGNGVSWTPLHRLQGTITPNGLHFERHHNGVPLIDPEQHRLYLLGKVARPLVFAIDELLRYPMVSRTCFIECGGNSNAAWYRKAIRSEAGYFHGLVSNSEWTGIPLGILLEEAGVHKEATWAIAEGGDAFAMNISIPVEKLWDDALLVLYQNGERLRPENGYPLRLLLPGWEGVLNVKWLRILKFVDRPAMTRNETARYTELLPSGKARIFSFDMEVKSLITSPSGEMFLPQQGLYEISGLAWSGSGRIRAVEVSADGGNTWAEAALQEPILPCAFTRFRLPWHWQGGTAVLQSRAYDERGAVQPDRATLINNRGRHGFFHYNAIVSWQVAANGKVTHVYTEDETKKAGSAADTAIDSDW